MSFELKNKSINVDKEGFLIDLNDWNEVTAEAIAKEEGIDLTEAHWEVIHLLRQFYQEFELSPAMRPLVKYVGQQLSKDKGNSMYLLTLFPGSPAKFASKIAGLPKPDNCL